MLCESVLPYLDEEGNPCPWDMYARDDYIRSLRENDPEVQIMHFPDYNWFDKEHMVKDPRKDNPFRFVPADFRERRIMLWSVKTRYNTYGQIYLAFGWNKNNDEEKAFVLSLN